MALLASGGTAQVPVGWTQYQSPNWPQSVGWGGALGTADLNGDKFDDLIVIESGASVSGTTAAGAVWLLHGPLGSKLPKFFASADAAAAELMGEVDIPSPGSSGVSAGDMDGDGHVDIALGSPHYSVANPFTSGVGRVHIFFGPDFSRELIFKDPTPEKDSYFGKSVLLADVTDDGRAELIVGAPNAASGSADAVIDSVGEVWVWASSNSFQMPLLVANPQPAALSRFGSSLDVVALNQASPNRLLVGAAGHPGGGIIQVYSVPGLAYETAVPPPFLPQGGALEFGDVAHCGDLTADGSDDLVVTAWRSFIECQSAGAVLILEGPTFQTAKCVLTSPAACTSTASGHFGWKTLPTDLNRDGFTDLIVGDVGQAWGEQRAYVFYGPDFGTTQELGDDFDVITVGFGIELAVGDYDGDGWDECAISAEEGSGSGSVYVHDVLTLLSDRSSLSASAGGTVAFTLSESPAEAGYLYLAALSASGSSPGTVAAPGVFLPLNVDPITLIGLSLLNGPLLPGFVGVLGAQGEGSFQIVLPAGSIGGLVGQTLTVAAVTATPEGHLASGSSHVVLEVAP